MGVKIVDTCLRDGHQSLLATRLTTEDILPVATLLDKAGYYALEVWGGATFDACLRFLNEDPWERLRAIRKACPNTKLQMLFKTLDAPATSFPPNVNTSVPTPPPAFA